MQASFEALPELLVDMDGRRMWAGIVTSVPASYQDIQNSCF
jgi:hypothetical protein